MIVRIGLFLLFCFLAVYAMAAERIAQVDVSLDPVAVHAYPRAGP